MYGYRIREVELNLLDKCKVPALLVALLFCGAGYGLGVETPTPETSAPAGAPEASIQPAEQLLLDTDADSARLIRGPRDIASGYYIIVKKDQHLLKLYRDGILLKTWPVGTGTNPSDKTKYQDSATPEGHYRIKAIHDARNWLYSPPSGGTKARNVYGPWFIRIDTDSAGSFSGKSWTGIGIHGTNKPESIGHDVSLGCIRMRNADVMELKAELDKAPDITKVQVDILP